jgi:hypothetical protein
MAHLRVRDSAALIPNHDRQWVQRSRRLLLISMVLVSIYSSHQSVLFVALRELTASAKMADSERADTIPLAEINTQEYATPASQTVDSVPPLDKITLLRLICSGYSFFCAGVNDGSLGPLIPYLLSTYDLNTNRVSIV